MSDSLTLRRLSQVTAMVFRRASVGRLENALAFSRVIETPAGVAGQVRAIATEGD